MLIAVFGDIHGNIEALKTAYDTLDSLKVDKIYHLGDLGGYAPFVNEAVDFIIEHKIEGVQGNYDFNIANASEHCGCKYEDPVQAEFAHKSFEWTKKQASLTSKKYMKELPFEISFIAHGKKIMLFHATPNKNNLYWYEERPEKFFLEMSGKTDADLLIYGHTHKPYRKDLRGKVFINAGSVGRSKDGNPKTCVTIINITDKDIISNFIRLPYDIDKTVKAIRESGLPSYFADRLKEAR